MKRSEEEIWDQITEYLKNNDKSALKKHFPCYLSSEHIIEALDRLEKVEVSMKKNDLGSMVGK